MNQPWADVAKTDQERAGWISNVAQHHRLRSRGVACLALAVSLLLGGCAVGPDFKKPAAPDVGHYTATPLSSTVGSRNVVDGEAQHFVEGGDVAADWWTLFHSKPLNALIE
jgi:hypothetical protein